MHTVIVALLTLSALTGLVGYVATVLNRWPLAFATVAAMWVGIVATFVLTYTGGTT